MSRPLKVLATLAAALIILVGGFQLIQRQAPAEASDAAETPPNTQSETVMVSRQDLTEEVSLTGSVNHGESRVLPIEASGLVTASHESGTVLNPTDEIVRVDNRPVTAASGDVPLYRELRLVGKYETDAANNRLGLMEGDDVKQLQSFLLWSGWNDNGRLEADGVFGLTTQRAVKEWQKDAGHPATGRVDRSQLVFIDGPIRIDTAPDIGSHFDQVLANNVKPTVGFEVTSRQRPFFTVGTEVSVETDQGTVPGRVETLKRTTGPDGSTRHAVTVAFIGDVPPGDVETAKVTSVRALAENVTTVPVRALVALAEGGWAVQAETATGAKLTSIELGKVVDGVAEISGLDEGDSVVVPS